MKMATGKEFINEAYRAIFEKDYQKAIEMFNKAIQLDSTNASYFYKLSVTYARNNSLDDALSAMEKALELRPDCLQYRQHFEMLKARKLSQKALSYAEMGNRDQDALIILEQAVVLDPLNTQVKLLLAFLLERNGKQKEALQTLYDLLALDPFHKEALELLKNIKQH